MSRERSALIDLLFPTENNDDPLEEHVNFDDYLWKIGTLKSDELSKEPNKLRDEKTFILQQTQELAVTNYKTFIQTAECSRNLFENFSNIDKKLDNLLENMPKFEQHCQVFASNTSGISMLRRLNSLTLTRSAQLLEILELPQLMDSFIKDGLYEDALELAAYVRRLYIKHQDIPIFKNIVDEINKSWLIMLHHLLAQLRQDLQLSQCLQIVSYLRRMEVFTETELRVKFLQTREVWLRRSLNSISESNANHRLNKIIEMTRVSLFSIITQYRAIFNDDEHNVPATKTQNVNQNIIFYNWIRDKITEFLTTLESELAGDVTSIDAIVGQCMYFGLSFSRVGCDFRSAMIPIFTNAIARNFQTSILKATRNFGKNMERFTLINKNHPTLPWKNKSADPIQPPESLLEFYPLAEYLNQVLTAFNELRLCPPFAIIETVISSLEESLLFISKAILTLYGQEQQAFTSNAKDAFVRLCLCYVDDLIPYIQKCFNIIYPPNLVASHVNSTVQKLQKEGIITLNREKVIEPLQHLLPAKIEPVLTTDGMKGNASGKEDKGSSDKVAESEYVAESTKKEEEMAP